MSGRILGVDFGEVRTGIAVSDENGFLASGVGTFRPSGMSELVAIIVEKAEEYKVKKIVIGNPLNLDGSASERSERVAAFADRLKETTEIPLILFDERMSTASAHVWLNQTGTHGKKRKGVVDTLAAQIILQDYLDSHKTP